MSRERQLGFSDFAVGIWSAAVYVMLASAIGVPRAALYVISVAGAVVGALYSNAERAKGA